MEKLDHITPAQIRTLTRKLIKEGPSILLTDKRNKNGFTAFLFCFYRQFNQLNDEEKELYVGGRYRLVPKKSAPDLAIPDNVDDDDEDALVEFFMQQTQAEALTSQERATIYKNNFADRHRKACRVWRGYNAATKATFKWMAGKLNEISIPGMIVQFPDFFYHMYKKNDLEATLIMSFYMDYTYIAGTIRLAIIGGASPHGNAKNRRYRFGFDDVRVGNHVYRKQMVVPTMLKFLLFGPFYSKIGLDPCITVARETKKNMHLHIPSSSSLASLFTIAGLCPVDFIHKKKRIRACGKVYFKILSGAELGNSYGYIITDYTEGNRWSMLCPGNLILSMPALTYPYNIENNNDNNHQYKSRGITFTVINYDPIKLIISKYSPFITFMMHKCTIKETSLLRDSQLIGNGCT